MKRQKTFTILGLTVCAVLFFHARGYSQRPAEWDRTVEAAKKEGRVVIGIPASPELRTALDAGMAKRWPEIQLEMIAGGGSVVARRILDEYKAGVRNFDLLISGAPTPLGILASGAAEPLEPYMILPEVKDPKQWWGGHIWGDNKSTKRFIYSFQAYLPDLTWYNAGLVKPEEIRSYDDLLQPRWKGKIGFLDPRVPGGGQAIWAYMRLVKGESYLTKAGGTEYSAERQPTSAS